MRILFTGASSFTGMWFVKELAKAGHEIVAPFLGSDYTGTRKERVEQIIPLCTPQFSCPFGSGAFMKLISEYDRWDVLCHHAADVRDYKSPDFNVPMALENNTHRLNDVLVKLQERGCSRVVLTGSVFEPHEGKGTDNLRAVSPYGLSKGLTYESFLYYTTVRKMSLNKFVIPNPFGPYEESRFTTYLAQNWLQGKTPKVAYPDYVRDNIHCSLLAKAYCRFVESGTGKINPSQYSESQGAFTARFSRELSKRWNLPCAFEICEQIDFTEPRVRVNTDPLEGIDWVESESWDELANYYQRILV